MLLNVYVTVTKATSMLLVYGALFYTCSTKATWLGIVKHHGFAQTNYVTHAASDMTVPWVKYEALDIT